MNPLVSIIIPAYNSEKTIRECVESCLTQTYSPLEILVIDDGSIDKTRQEIEDYIQSSRISYHYQQNQERSAARNNGLNLARGEYINFLDSDDLLLPDKITAQVAVLTKNPHFFAVMSGTRYFDDQTRKTLFILHGNLEGEADTNQLVYHNFIPIQSILFKRNSIRFDENLNACEDWNYFLNLLFHKRVYHMKAYHSCVRVTGQTSFKYLAKMTAGDIAQYKKNFFDARFKNFMLGICARLVKKYLQLIYYRFRVMQMHSKKNKYR